MTGADLTGALETSVPRMWDAASLRRGVDPASGGPSFSSVLGRFKPDVATMSPEEKARAAAEEFVATSLVLPVLKQLRETNEAWGPFKPGRHEKVFGDMFDGEIASQIVSAQNFPLVDRLARDLLAGEKAQAALRDTGPSVDTEA